MLEKYNEEQEAKKIVNDLSNYINNMSHDNSKIVKLIMNEHRTIQQQMFGLVLDIIKGWSESNSDLRNEYTINKCKEIIKLFPDGTRTPFI